MRSRTSPNRIELIGIVSHTTTDERITKILVTGVDTSQTKQEVHARVNSAPEAGIIVCKFQEELDILRRRHLEFGLAQLGALYGSMVERP